jgi:tetratricopeptide (TPR) repeat protein
MPKVREQAITSYRDYLAQYPDSPERDRVTRRLADLLLEQAADLQLAAATTTADSARLEADAMQAYAAAIRHYEYLLQRDPHGPQSTAVLYQLARAYQESGASQQALTTIDRLLAQQPDTDLRLYTDTRFRQGELLFAQGNYLEAGRCYQAVVDLGTSVPAYEQSLYKLGWSLFKQQQYRDALPALFSFLELKLAPARVYNPQLPGLSPGDREQIADQFRLISRSFAQLGGADAVKNYCRNSNGCSYEEQVYLQLAQWYIEQEQINEAARTLQAVAQRDPLAPQSPRLITRAIELYRQVGFQQRTLALETLFVQTYGMSSDFWTLHSPADFPQVVLSLQSSLQELARASHEQARTTGDAGDVRKAQQWYREYLAWFGDAAAAAEMNFQLAELLYESGQYRLAMDEYERTAWSRGPHSRTADAALGALHAGEKAMQHAGATERPELSERTTATALRLVLEIPDHPAAPDVLAHSGTVLLEQHQYDRAFAASERIVAGSAVAPPALTQVAWSLRAQVFFIKGDYPAAATAYREALQLAGKADERQPALQAGLAMATYKQAELALYQGDKTRAATLYQRAAELAPDTAIRSMAIYDAASTLLMLESWPQAISLLEQYRADYPQDPLQPEVTRKLAYACENSGDHNRAATEYLRLAQDPQLADTLQREAQLRAADIYLQEGAVELAISTNERYLERFPEPAAAATKVMWQLAELESGKGDSRRRRYWLEAIISLDRRSGNSQSRTPAAKAALELAEHRLNAFRGVQLVNPVQDNLALKIQAMKQALQAFEAAIDYGIPPVTSAASYHLASMYAELGRDLLASERPRGLTVEELAEYDVLLAKQAAPFEQKAIDLYTTHAQRPGADQRDPWAEKSAQQLDSLLGVR